MNKRLRILKAKRELHDIMEKKQKYKDIGGSIVFKIFLVLGMWVFFGLGLLAWTQDPVERAVGWRMLWPWLSLVTAIVVFAVVWTKLQRVK